MISLKLGSKVGPCIPFCMLKFQVDRLAHDRATADRARSTHNRRSRTASGIEIWCRVGNLALIAQSLTDWGEIWNRDTLIGMLEHSAERFGPVLFTLF